MKGLSWGAWGAAVAVVLVMGGCASQSDVTRVSVQACPAGQEPMRMAQLYFGRSMPGQSTVSDAEFKAFLDQEITPRFPDGLTVIDGGGQWRGPEAQLIREASKVVQIVLPPRGGRDSLDQVRKAYKARFRQDSVMLVTQAACVSF